MLDPRIYRAALLPVVVAVAVAAFSLRSQPAPATTPLATSGFSAQRAYYGPIGLAALESDYPDRRPGSTGDSDIAQLVRETLSTPLTGSKLPPFDVSTRHVAAQTIDGRRDVETVVGVRSGLSSHRIVVLADRDAAGGSAAASLSGTATLLELAHILGGRPLQKTLVLVSTSGASGGNAGAADWAREAGGPVDAVIALGDLASTRAGHRPLVVGWGSGRGVAPAIVSATVGSALVTETGDAPGGTSPFVQFARLALPLAIGDQGPLVASGLPAVLLSASGEHTPASGAPVSPERLQAYGRAVLRAVLAFDATPNLPGDQVTRSLSTARMSIPEWAVTLVVAALLLPVLLTVLDGLARVRRRGERLLPWFGWALALAIPFALAAGFARLLVPLGLLHAAPPSLLPPGAIPLHASGAGLIVAELLIVVAGFLALRLFWRRVLRVNTAPVTAAPAGALLTLGTLTAIVVLVLNPYAAALLVPLLHLSLLALAPDLRLRRPPALALVVLGLAPLALVALTYSLAFGLGPAQLAWGLLLYAASGALGVGHVLLWALALGWLAGIVTTILARETVAAPAPAVTVRGPLGYAGPGSLGGTSSALRR